MPVVIRVSWPLPEDWRAGKGSIVQALDEGSNRDGDMKAVFDPNAQQFLYKNCVLVSS